MCLEDFKALSDDNLCRISVNFDVGCTPDYIFITYGRIYEKVVAASKILRDEGMNVGVIIVETLKPYDKTAMLLSGILSSCKRVVYVEEGFRNGGAAEITRRELEKCGINLSSNKYRIVAIDDNFASPDSPCDIYEYVGLSVECIADKMRR